MYFTGSNKQILRQDVLVKRSQGKSKISTYNYKQRVFVLTPLELAYHEGTVEKVGKKKGCIELQKIKVIEEVDDNALDKKFCFQIQYGEWILYIIAASTEQRQDWIHSIRDEITSNKLILENYHSGIYNGCWTCCQEKEKQLVGCRKTFFGNKITVDSQPKRRADIPLPPVPVENSNLKTDVNVIAIYDFSAMQPGDLSLRKDEEYVVSDKSQPNWWKARDSQGKEGYIPSNYVRQVYGLESEKWYHGDMSRDDVDEILKSDEWKDKDGVFLIRNSSKRGTYTMSLTFQGAVKHYHIKKDDDAKYFVSQRHRFDGILELVEYHKHNSAGLVTRLRYPYTNQGDAPSTPALGHDIFEINRNELTLGRQLGVGQFGSVHEGLWKERTKVAVKMMKEGTMSEDDFIEEAKVMAQFQHKHLVKLFGVCSREKPLYLVTELMPLGSLLGYLRNNQVLLDKLSKLLSMIFQISEAMMYLEESQFIHRDLAARNCLVGQRNMVKVADFGLARYVLDDEYTASEGTKFPVKWASPEVIQYTRFSSKSDVWAYGILCWEVFTAGKTPYPAMSNPQVAEEIIRGFRLSRPPKCPEYVHDIMIRCWDMDTEKRPSFKDINKILDDLTEDYSNR